MKNLLLLLLGINSFTLLGQKGLFFESDLDPGQVVIASLLTPSNQYYVATGEALQDPTFTFKYDFSKNVTLFHYDSTMKFVRKITLKPLKVNKEFARIHSMIAIGGVVGFITSSDYFKPYSANIDLVTFSETDLVIQKKTTSICSFLLPGTYGMGRNYEIEYKQCSQGGDAVVLVQYQIGTVNGPGSTLLTKVFEFYQLGRELSSIKLNSWNEKEDNKQYEIEDFTITVENDIYIFLSSENKIDHDESIPFEEDADWKQKNGVEVPQNTIYLYSQSKQTNKSNFSFKNSTLRPESIQFFQNGKEVWIGGVTGNADFIFRKRLIGDTIGLPEESIGFFAMQTSRSQEIIAESSSTMLLNSAEKQKLLRVESLAERDREMGAEELLGLVAIRSTGFDQVSFVLVKSVQHIWPLFEDARQNNAYKFTRDDNGKITDIEGEPDWHLRYHELCVVELDFGKKQLNIFRTNIGGRENLGFAFSSDSKTNQICIGQSPSGEMQIHYTSQNGDLTSVYSWNCKSEPVKFEFTSNEFKLLQIPYGVPEKKTRFTLIQAQKIYVFKGI